MKNPDQLSIADRSQILADLEAICQWLHHERSVAKRNPMRLKSAIDERRALPAG
jgi:hypothetical protein